MTKDVLVAIRGLRFDGTSEEENSETITTANYYKKNDHHYIVYDEVTEGFVESTKNIIKFNEKEFDLTKKGLVNVHMIFEKNKKNVTSYATPYGDILIGIDAIEVNLEETDHKIRVNIDYSLEVNYEHLAECKITMDVLDKETKTKFF